MNLLAIVMLKSNALRFVVIKSEIVAGSLCKAMERKKSTTNTNTKAN